LPNVGPYIYTTLAFLALLGAPYIYDISSLRVKRMIRYAGTHLLSCVGTACSVFTLTLTAKKQQVCVTLVF